MTDPLTKRANVIWFILLGLFLVEGAVVIWTYQRRSRTQSNSSTILQEESSHIPTLVGELLAKSQTLTPSQKSIIQQRQAFMKRLTWIRREGDLPKATTYQFNKLEQRNLLARRKYLLYKVYSKRASPQQMPKAIGEQFQGEWALVTASMTALALTNLSFHFPRTRPKTITVLDQLLQRSLSSAMRKFDRDRWKEDPLDSFKNDKGHIGYLGHLNLMLAARLVLGPSAKWSKLFREVSQSLNRKHRRNPLLLAETYPDERYLPDHAVVMASMAWFDRLFPQHRTRLAQDWLRSMLKCCVDPHTGLFVFAVTEEGKTIVSTRGSGSTWNLYYLSHVNRHFVQHQFPKVKKHFVQYLLGAGVREWPHGIHKSGDIDSGPLVFGISPSATGFAVGGARITGDNVLYHKLLLTASFGGLTTESKGRRYYAVAPLVGEAALLAMRTYYPWDLRFRPDLTPKK